VGGLQGVVDARSVLVSRQLSPGEGGWAGSRAQSTRGACSWAGSCRRARGEVGGLQGVVDARSVLVGRQLSPGEGGGGWSPGRSRHGERVGAQAAVAGRGGRWTVPRA